MEATTIKLQKLLNYLQQLTNYSSENVILISEIRHDLFNILSNLSFKGDDEWKSILDDLTNDVNRHLRTLIESSLDFEKIDSYDKAFEYLRQDVKDSIAKIERL